MRAAVVSAAALVAAACINPTSPSEEFEGRRLGALSLVPFLQVSVSPDPATAQASEDPDLPWTVEFTVTVREVAGADVEVSRITVGAQSHTSFNRDDITAAAGMPSTFRPCRPRTGCRGPPSACFSR